MKTIIKIFICLSLIYTPMFANAANVGGWSLGNPVSKGASVIYDASKNVVINGKDFVKDSWVKITPTASQVSKVLARGGAGYALSVAVEQLIGAVDWVLDPANNQIKYYELDPTNPSLFPRIYSWNDFYPRNGKSTTFYNLNESCIDAFQNYGGGEKPVFTRSELSSQNSSISVFKCYAVYKNGVQVSTYTTSVVNPAYDPNAEKDEKTLPLDVVSQRVISNAQNGDTNAQVATTAAAADVVAEAENDDAKARPIANQAEANAETKPADEDAAANANTGAATATPQADPVTGEQAPPTDISLEFPVFCNWAPTICEAAQVVISFPNTLTGWYNDTKTKAEEWATSITEAYHDFLNDDELPNDDTTLDITELPVPELQENAISWGASCPADVSIPISMQGVSSTLVFSWSPWCQLLSIIKPAIVASAYIGAAFIVLGLRT